jgi:hypothetical protein
LKCVAWMTALTGQSLPGFRFGCKWSSATRQSLSCRTRNGRMQGLLGMAAATAPDKRSHTAQVNFKRKKNDAATALRKSRQHARLAGKLRLSGSCPGDSGPSDPTVGSICPARAASGIFSPETETRRCARRSSDSESSWPAGLF